LACRNPARGKRGDGRTLEAERTIAVGMSDFTLGALIIRTDGDGNGFAILAFQFWQGEDLWAPALLIFEEIQNIFMME
jgi:hypothetical protein